MLNKQKKCLMSNVNTLNYQDNLNKTPYNKSKYEIIKEIKYFI